jgi:hypothetical protein
LEERVKCHRDIPRQQPSGSAETSNSIKRIKKYSNLTEWTSLADLRACGCLAIPHPNLKHINLSETNRSEEEGNQSYSPQRQLAMLIRLPNIIIKVQNSHRPGIQTRSDVSNEGYLAVRPPWLKSSSAEIANDNMPWRKESQ